jgi:hypothetical protein
VLQRAYPEQVCSIARALEVIGERWTLLIVRDATLGMERFEEFQADLGIASNVLTNRLKLLCDERPRPRAPGAAEVRPHRQGRRARAGPDRAHEMGRLPLPHARRAAATHRPRGLRRQHRP